ncbi:hypothetical protein MTR_2035s0010 [Medicago truncatula]|uniref:Uncharacterized protein n=1 Tax=Medicago truncatula TaxID=3880 RepID=A0A072TC45_MEDTR|nr:hypothetical protein MTR_2035s0010 [Medicago truncatula]
MPGKRSPARTRSCSARRPTWAARAGSSRSLPTHPRRSGSKADGGTRSLAASPTAQASTATSSTRSNTSSCWPGSTAASGSAWTSSRRT